MVFGKLWVWFRSDSTDSLRFGFPGNLSLFSVLSGLLYFFFFSCSGKYLESVQAWNLAILFKVFRLVLFLHNKLISSAAQGSLGEESGTFWIRKKKQNLKKYQTQTFPRAQTLAFVFVQVLMAFFSCGQGISVNFPAYIATIVTMRDKSKSSQNTAQRPC